MDNINKRKRKDGPSSHTDQPISKKAISIPSHTKEILSDISHKKPIIKTKVSDRSQSKPIAKEKLTDHPHKKTITKNKQFITRPRKNTICDTVDFMEVSTRYTGGLPFPKIFTTDETKLPLEHVFDTTEKINNDLLNYGRYLATLHNGEIEIDKVKSTGNFSRDITYVILKILKNCNTDIIYDIVKINKIELLVLVNYDICDVFNVDSGYKLNNDCLSTILKWILKGDITELLTYMFSERILTKSVYEHTCSLLSEIPYRLTSGDLLNIMTQSKVTSTSTKHEHEPTNEILIGSLSELIQMVLNKYNVQNFEHNTTFKTMVHIQGRFNWWNMNCQTAEMPQLRSISINNFNISNFLKEFLENILFNQLTDNQTMRCLENRLIFGKTCIIETPVLLTYSFGKHKIRSFFVHSEEMLNDPNVDFIQLAINILVNSCCDYDNNTVRKILKNLICGDADDLENDHVWIGPITSPLCREILEYETKIQEGLSTYIRYIKDDKMIPLVRQKGETYLSLSAHKQMDSAHIHLEYRNLMKELKSNIDNYICDNIGNINKLHFIVNELGIIRDSTIVDYVRNYSDVNDFICSFISQWSRGDKYNYAYFLPAFVNYMCHLAQGKVSIISENLNQYEISNSLIYVFVSVPNTLEVETLAYIRKVQEKLSDYSHDKYFSSSDMDCTVDETEKNLQRYDLSLILQFICRTGKSDILLFVDEYKSLRENIIVIRNQIPSILSDILLRRSGDTHVEFLSYLKTNVRVLLNAEFIFIYILYLDNKPTLMTQTKAVASYYSYQECWDRFWEDIAIAYNSKEPIPKPQHEKQWIRGISSSEFINKVLNVLTLTLRKYSELLDKKLFTRIIFSFVVMELPTNYKNNVMLIPFQDLVNNGHELSVRSDRYDMYTQNVTKLSHGLFLQSLSAVESWLTLTHTESVRIGIVKRDSMHILLIDDEQINIDLSDNNTYFTHKSPLFNYLLKSLLENEYNCRTNNLFFLNCLKISKENTRTFLNDVAVKVRDIILSNLENKTLFTLYKENSVTLDIVAFYESKLQDIVLLNDTRQLNISLYDGKDLLISLQSLQSETDVLNVDSENKITIYINDDKEFSFILRQWPLDKKMQYILNTIWRTVKYKKGLLETSTRSQPLYGYYEFIEYIMKNISGTLSQKIPVNREMLKNYLLAKYTDDVNRKICIWLSHVEEQFGKSLNVSIPSNPFLSFVQSLEYFLICALNIDSKSYYEDFRIMSCYAALKSVIEKLANSDKNITCTIVSEEWEFCIVSNNSHPYHIVLLSDLLHVDGEQLFDIYRLNMNIMNHDVPFDIQTGNEVHNYSWYFNPRNELFRTIVENMEDDFREKYFSKLAPAFFIHTPHISLFTSKFIPTNTFESVFSTLFRKNMNRTDNYLIFYETIKKNIRNTLLMNENDTYYFGEKDGMQLYAQFIEINNRDYFITSRINKDDKLLKIEDYIYLGDHNKVKGLEHLILCEDKYEVDKETFGLIVEKMYEITIVYSGPSVKISFPTGIIKLLTCIGGYEKILPTTQNTECFSESIKFIMSIIKLFPIFTNHIKTIIDAIIEKFNLFEIN